MLTFSIVRECVHVTKFARAELELGDIEWQSGGASPRAIVSRRQIAV